jgi:membrane-associated phospholipid phosphatase
VLGRVSHESRRYWRGAVIFGVAFAALVSIVALGWLRPLDVTLGRAAKTEVPCWTLYVSDASSLLLAAELSLVYAGLLALFFVWQRRPLLGVAVVGLLFVTVAVELGFKHGFYQPSPGVTLVGADRSDCYRFTYPLTSVSSSVIPNSLPSGFTTRAAYFGVLLAALVGARWPRFAEPARLLLLPILLVLAATRVVIAWHWTTDIVAGLLLGAAMAYLLLALADGFRWLRPVASRSMQPAGHDAVGRPTSRR